MTLLTTPQLGRRRLIAGSLAAAGTLILPPDLRAQAAGLVPTPPQTTGPFYPVTFPSDVDSDLVVLRGAEARAEGVVTHVMGRVLGVDGRPIPDATVEIWQCDARGRYLHPGDTGSRPRDSAFQGFGRVVSAADGTYRFRTIQPGAYPWRNHLNAWRPAHIHFSLFGTDFTQRLVTQMYFPGDPLFALDPIFQSVTDPKARDMLIAQYDHDLTTPEVSLGFRWDIVLTGTHRTPLDEEVDR